VNDVRVVVNDARVVVNDVCVGSEKTSASS